MTIGGCEFVIADSDVVVDDIGVAVGAKRPFMDKGQVGQVEEVLDEPWTGGGYGPGFTQRTLAGESFERRVARELPRGIAEAGPPQVIGPLGHKGWKLGGFGWGPVRMGGLGNTSAANIKPPPVIGACQFLTVKGSKAELGTPVGTGVGNNRNQSIVVTQKKVTTIEELKRY